jgi:hypothetical protein
VSTNVSNATKAKENRSTHLQREREREERRENKRTTGVHSRVELYSVHLHRPAAQVTLHLGLHFVTAQC